MELLDVLNVLDTPILLVNRAGQLEWANQAAKVTVCSGVDLDTWNHEHNLPQGYSYIMHKGPFGPDRTLIECIRLPEGPDENTIWALKQENTELAELINSSLDEWYITDGEGITLQVNDKVEQLYGPLVGGLVGKSVFELEHQRIFYPSVTALVLRHRTQQTVLQNTVDGRRLISTGNAIFNPDGSIKRVISYAKDVTELELLTLPGRTGSDVPNPHRTLPAPFISGSPAMRRCMDLALRVARTEAAVMILGETGVGKNRVAKSIHDASQRSAGPFVEINCASIPEALLESELFGYERGSFTGARREGKPGKVELAQGGTLFLNEIGELPLHLQGKLLDLIQEHRIERIGSTRPAYLDARIITATNRSLREMVAAGTFRADLYYRLNVVTLHIPPLRERKEDIARLCEVYLEHFVQLHGKDTRAWSQAALASLTAYPWPGNIRELENMIEYLVITTDEPTIGPHHLPQDLMGTAHEALRGDAHDGPSSGFASDGTDLAQHAQDVQVVAPGRALPGQTLKAYIHGTERELYRQALADGASTREIAARLGVSQSTVVRKLRQFGLRQRR
ncbi:sigma 54-interacting transcriptional regulator [Alicyclobacillus cycloheptanicus]|uniref:HTH-type transcriptional regulatory protein TyrR n=1 Tax=Alicyclobacillus cycloheptanicus TaxID=1457 RepID=A0ABT9XHR8_9BACL|nr:sigma 54-interacting transcriptional regulator [Alicyclobacillus cycloheptanicus]MDQ0189863.1 PAS domain S-box-containing protein [Alicyclobacillus cycloheptanicus]WDM02454.1 sigma 54-interacting transcriptional regulator [Alicyclobacillus cycloheptanicus]